MVINTPICIFTFNRIRIISILSNTYMNEYGCERILIFYLPCPSQSQILCNICILPLEFKIIEMQSNIHFARVSKVPYGNTLNRQSMTTVGRYITVQ